MSAVSRRRFLAGAGAVALTGGALAAGIKLAGERASARIVPDVELGLQPSGLPARQYAWEAFLARDQFGNPVPPRFDRLLFFDVIGDPTAAYARLLEATLRTLERAFPWRHDGLLFTVGWSPDYFEEVLRRPSPIPRARRLSDFELPVIDDYHLALHLACDDARRLAEVQAALVHGAPLKHARGPLCLASILRLREARTGFVGPGLPAAHQDIGGIPPGSVVPQAAPMFMGFKSSLLKNQASEQDVTIESGAFADGTTMTVSYMRLRLDFWYEQLSQRGRVARMYAPQVTPEQAARFTTDAESDPEGYEQAVRRYGVVGHAQASARARRNGRPVILRRDFDTADGNQAGVHFVSLQRSIEDFVRTRRAMNASDAQLQNPAITDTVNNGINEFIFVLRRANYIVPSRAQRSFPLLPGRERGLS
jgi:hypothetical protein